VRLVERDAQMVILSVHNEGPPIPAEAMNGLFEPFRRLNGSDANARSSLGLGLYIAREIVRAHGGTIQVHSTTDDGTEFRVCLPRLSASASLASCPEQLSA
jgi:signal transduction histidine kinase